MKTIIALSPKLIHTHVAASDIVAVYGTPHHIQFTTSGEKPTTTLTLDNKDESVRVTLWYNNESIKEYEGNEIVFYAPKRRGISIVKSHGGGSWLWISKTVAIFPKDMFEEHMKTKKKKVAFL